MKKWLCILSLICLFAMNAQENRQITGLVCDKETGNILVSASVYYSHSSKRTITNKEGEFLIEKMTGGDSLIFSYVGYASKKYAVDRVPSKIALEPLTVDLAEVIVKPFDVNDFVKQIWEKYNKIYLDEKDNKDKESSFFYRQITQIDSIYSEFIECFFTADNTYRLGNELLLKESRYAKIKSDSIYITVSFKNYYSFSLLSPFSHINLKGSNVFIQPNFNTVYDVSIDNYLYSEEGRIIVLNFTLKKGTKIKGLSGKLYVRESDLTIIKMEGTDNSGMTISPKTLRIKNIYSSFCINYKDGIKGYPIVESVNCTTNFNVSILFKKKSCRFHINSTLFAVDMKFDAAKDQTKTGKNLLELVSEMKYNPEFWEKNPVVKRTPVDEKIIKSFENKNAFGTLINK